MEISPSHLCLDTMRTVRQVCDRRLLLSLFTVCVKPAPSATFSVASHCLRRLRWSSGHLFRGLWLQNWTWEEEQRGQGEQRSS